MSEDSALNTWFVIRDDGLEPASALFQFILYTLPGLSSPSKSPYKLRQRNWFSDCIVQPFVIRNPDLPLFNKVLHFRLCTVDVQLLQRLDLDDPSEEVSLQPGPEQFVLERFLVLAAV